jgi:glutamate formiminotransferase
MEVGAGAGAGAARRHLITSTTPLPRTGTVSCNVYISEGRDTTLLDELEAEARSASPGQACIVSQLRDPHYHRTGFTLGGRPHGVATAAASLAVAALARLDLRKHVGALHPRIGVVDHLSVHALCGTETEVAVAVGRRVAECLAAIGVPVSLYGSLSKDGQRLASVRRNLNYFKNRSGDEGVYDRDPRISLVKGHGSAPFDMGPDVPDGLKGCTAVGVVPFMQSYNVRLRTSDRSKVLPITRAVREKDGGLPGVEAVTLRHEGGMWEVACNMLRPAESTTEMVLEIVEAEAAKQGLEVDDEYLIGFTSEEALCSIIEEGLKLVDGPSSTRK